MRTRSILSFVAILAMPFAFTGCGDDSTSSNDTPPTSNPSNPQALGQLGSMAVNYKSMADTYLQMAQGMATGFASGFAPSAQRSSAAENCKLNQTFSEDGVTSVIKVTTADGKTLLTTCAEANAAYSSPSGIGIQMKMTTTQGSMAIVMNLMMAYKPVGTAGGYNAVMDIDVSMTANTQGQSVNIGIGPIHVSASAADANTEAVIDGYMTFAMPPYTIEKVSFDGNGLKSGSFSILENGSVVAKLVVDANGNAVVKDLNGNVIQG